MSELDIKKTDLDVGGGVYVRYFSTNGERVGAFIIHPKAPDDKSGFKHCWGTICFPNHPTEKTTWEFDGDYEKPTFSPSILCSCGFHGFIRKGKWIPA